MEQNENLKNILNHFEEEHRDLDEIIHQMYANKTINLMQIKRLKKRKLLLRDKIIKLKNQIEPDIIA
ncbi:MAG: hypothetical protein CFH21_01001 [Alphaproteobacteria bacterium MarineAlpha5_Bin11]|nr:hypothetical protein [Pelagibacteraceae bacterium]PPR42812.1 MAG: hypothetical protein CFH21_01001 [Alphaproteobacteria bacterium MarineAlpha5_Bin11]PPR52023.1 MAG: hypothetical protein CFH20_00211 [Alphaproteobacteria bacterium MarineAlpha5_Bin10]|tara:strand:+ start:2479 stop:2679 length:201 start_codon:yes stop_codon:yes gene_type:complete